jgi:pyruvate formate lyase activating enzyme
MNITKNKDLGLITQIVHGSFVDGHGIRTTVFLKGCPLRCLWCCNPECQKGYPELSFTSSRCNGCGNCIPACPVNAIREDSSSSGVIMIDRELCTNCGTCIEKCFTGALEFFGKFYSVDELVQVVIKDSQYYQSSGGGVTIGGGEPTFQPSFTKAFLKKCHDNYLHVAIDTCGYTASDEGLEILKEADLLLYDLKNMDTEAHRKITGKANDIILSNLKMLDSIGKEIIIRMPLIPEHTDYEKNVHATAEFLSILKSIKRVDLMLFHRYGEIKYQKLGKPYALDNLQPINNHMGDDVMQIFLNHGLNAQLGG